MTELNRYRELIFTDHALARLQERQIPLRDAWFVWRRPDVTEKGRSPGSWKYTRSKEDQTIRVIAKKNDQGEWLILSAWAKKSGENKNIF